MKRTLLLTSAAIALTLGMAPAMAQQDRTDSKVKHDRSATEQRDRDTSKKLDKDQTGTRDTTGQADGANADKAKAAETDTNKPNAGKAQRTEGDKTSAQPKQAEEQNKKPASNTATDKSNTAEPSKNAQQNNTRSPDAQKSTQSTEPHRNAPANAKANDKAGEANRNAQTSEPNRNAATNNAEPKARISASLDPQKKTRVTTRRNQARIRYATIHRTRKADSPRGVDREAFGLDPVRAPKTRVCRQGAERTRRFRQGSSGLRPASQSLGRSTPTRGVEREALGLDPADRAGVQQAPDDGDDAAEHDAAFPPDRETARLHERAGPDSAHVRVLAPLQR